MQNVQHIVGIDLSKKSFDLYYHQGKQHASFPNDPKGFIQLIQWVEQIGIKLSDLLVVMEHTGLYSYCLEDFLHRHSIAFAKVSALQIIRSSGVTRGKSDKLDARRIAAYGFEKSSTLQCSQKQDESLKRLRLLQSTRENLVRNKAGMLNTLEEYRNIGLPKNDLIIQTQLKVIEALDKQIAKLQSQIDDIIEQDRKLQTNYRLLQTIKGVGPVLSLAVLIKTGNFQKFTDGRKFACYCGVAPFEHTSGSSIRGKTRVSHLADKRMKTLLDLSAKSAIQFDKELKDFYLKRIEKGKPKMSTINIVRNKIIYRMFAVIKRQTPFIDNYLQVA